MTILTKSSISRSYPAEKGKRNFTKWIWFKSRTWTNFGSSLTLTSPRRTKLSITSRQRLPNNQLKVLNNKHFWMKYKKIKLMTRYISKLCPRDMALKKMWPVSKKLQELIKSQNLSRRRGNRDSHEGMEEKNFLKLCRLEENLVLTKITCKLIIQNLIIIPKWMTQNRFRVRML